MADFAVAYHCCLPCAHTEQGEAVRHLMEVLPDMWCAQYRLMAGASRHVLEFDDRGFTFLFDFTSGLDEPELADDRVVAAFGMTFPAPQDRDTSRIRGQPLGVEPEAIDGSYDRGHFISHLAGGSLDVNLFPHKREVNRGWSEEGKLFRRMERYAAERPGTFCFARPIYRDRTCCPAVLEYGVLRQEGTLWVERFGNR